MTSSRSSKLGTYGTALVCGLFAACFSVSAASKDLLNSQQIKAVMTSSDRPAEDSQRDEARKPDKILKFAGVKTGDTVLDLFAGDGWYTELYSKAVGPDGKVYAQNDEVIWRFAQEGIKKRTAENRLPNVVRQDNIAIADIDVPNNSVDIVFMALNYHDLFFTHMMRDGKLVSVRDDIVDHKAVLATIKRVLKDEGVVVIIDHFAPSGSGYAAANNQHRIDPNIVKFQFAEAGFDLLEEAFYLRNEQDNLNLSVFDPGIRGKTNRFIYKFGK